MAPRKRPAPKQPEMTSSGRRRSTRIGSSAKKSQYFEDDDDPESDSEVEQQQSSKRAKTGSGVLYTGRRGPRPDDSDDDSENAYAPPDEEEEDDDGDDGDGGEDDDQDEDEEVEDDTTVRRKSSHKKPKVKVKTGDTDDDQDNEDEDDNAVTFIPHKKLRDTNGIPYVDERLHPNTLLFLADLRANNERAWLKANDKEYRRTLTDWNTFVETLTPRVVDLDETVPAELPLSQVIFRIYRDIRFSKDPTPYKPHYSAAWSRTGRKGPYACYYVHCEPGGRCMVGGGMWQPDADSLQRLRASIDERPGRWRRVLVEDERFRGMFLPKAKRGDEKSVFRAFADANKSNALKTKPRDYRADHRHIELLKLRNFTVSKKIPDEVFTGDDAVDKIAEIVEAMVGFVTHLNRIVLPDEDDEDSGNEEGDEVGSNSEDGEDV